MGGGGANKLIGGGAMKLIAAPATSMAGYESDGGGGRKLIKGL